MVEIEKPLPLEQQPDDIAFCAKNGESISLIAASSRYHRPWRGRHQIPERILRSGHASRVRLKGSGSTIMRGKLDGPEAIRLWKYDAQATGVALIDREALEGVMREDVFWPQMAKRLGHDPIEFWGIQRVEACVDPRPSSPSSDLLHLAERLRAVTAVVAPTPSSRLEIAITV